MSDIEIVQPRAQKAGQGGIPACRVIVQPVSQVNRGDAGGGALAAKGIFFGARFVWDLLEAPIQAPVRGEHGDGVATRGQAFSERANFHGRTSKFEERVVTL